MNPTKRSKAALERAITLLDGLSNFARSVGESPQTVQNWRRRGVPVDKCVAVERATRDAGDRVQCEELRPDIEWEVLRSLRKVATA